MSVVNFIVEYTTDLLVLSQSFPLVIYTVFVLI